MLGSLHGHLGFCSTKQIIKDGFGLVEACSGGPTVQEKVPARVGRGSISKLAARFASVKWRLSYFNLFAGEHFIPEVFKSLIIAQHLKNSRKEARFSLMKHYLWS